MKKRVMDRVIERGKTGSGNGLSLHSHAVAEAKGNSKFRQDTDDGKMWVRGPSKDQAAVV